jgi:ribosome-binding factor A
MERFTGGSGPANTLFVLAGIAIPEERWKECDRHVTEIKVKSDLHEAEIHTAWMFRDYPEQKLVKDRRRAALGIRTMNLARTRTLTGLRELSKN